MSSLPHPDRLRALVDSIECGLLERAAAARLLLLAALAGEHVLLIGPPGTAKSELARRLQHAFDGARWFEHLLTRFSVPEELFGPLSIKALEDDRYERLTDGYLPTAGVAFLDEVFKANSAILNALLTLLNEREFDNGGTRIAVPLVCAVGATNEVPGDDALAAFYDRFLLRVPVQPVGDAHFAALLALPDLRRSAGAARPAALGTDERAALLDAAEGVALPAPVIDALAAARAQAARMQIVVSDRRWRQLAALLRVAAASSGRREVLRCDLWLLPYALGHDADQVAALHTWVQAELLAARPVEAPWLTRAVEAFERQLELETSQQQDDGEAGKLALARAISGPANESGEPGMMRMVAATLEERLRKRYGRLHIEARCAQVDEVRTRAGAQADALRAHAARLRAEIDAVLWLPPVLADEMRTALAQSEALFDHLLARLDATRAGFAGLPHDVALDSIAPAPVALQA